jgi:WD40 repeat protein
MIRRAIESLQQSFERWPRIVRIGLVWGVIAPTMTALLLWGVIRWFYPPPLNLIGHQKAINAVDVDSEKGVIASASDDHSAMLWWLSSATPRMTLRGHREALLAIAVRPGDWLQVATGSRDDTIRLWDIQTGTEIRTLRGHKGDVSGVDFTNDGNQLVSAAADNTIMIWDLKSDSPKNVITSTHGARQIRCSPTRFVAASAGWHHMISIWNLSTLREELQLRGHTDYVSGLSFRADGDRLASASKDDTARVWDLTNGRELAALVHESDLKSVAFVDENRIVTVCADGLVRVWDYSTGSIVETLPGHPSQALCVDYPEGGPLVTGGWQSTLINWRRRL